MLEGLKTTEIGLCIYFPAVSIRTVGRQNIASPYALEIEVARCKATQIGITHSGLTDVWVYIERARRSRIANNFVLLMMQF
jgi:hypothetical protein